MNKCASHNWNKICTIKLIRLFARTFFNFSRVMLARILATAVLTEFDLSFLVHVGFVTLKFARECETGATDVAGVRSFGRCADGNGGGRLHDNLLLQIARCGVVDALVVCEQAHVTEHQTADIALEGRVCRRSNAHLVKQSVVADRLHVKATETLVIGGD